MTNYGLQVTLSLGWNGNPLYDINGELVQPTDRNIRERARAEAYWEGKSTNTNSASMSLGDVVLPFVEFDSETGYPADWGDADVPQQQYVMVYFEIPGPIVSALLKLMDMEESEFENDDFIEFEGDFDALTGLSFSLTFNGQNVFPEVMPAISVYRK